MLMNLLLIPRYGILAASLVTVATELVGAIMFYRIFRREFGPGLGLTSMLRMGLSVGIMSILLYLLRGWNTFLLVAIGAGSYALSILLTRTLDAEEQGMLIHAAQRIAGKLLRRG